MLKRIFKFSLRLGALVAIAAIVIKLLEDRPAPVVAPPVEPPVDPEPPKPQRPLRAELIEDTPPVEANRKVRVNAKPAAKRAEMVSWVEPHGTVCPTSHPIKAKLGSKVFRKPETPGYENSKPDRCYASEGAAQRAGFREAQR